MEFLGSLPSNVLIVFLVAMFVAFAFEFVNGFHDTANAVATVIYTKSLAPRTAVLWSGFFNFLGVLLSGITVAYSIVYLLPVDLLLESSSNAGLAMVLALLLAAITWNLGTWYYGIPCSSSHSLIGAILGVGLIHGVLANKPFGSGVNWDKAIEIGLSLLLSPLFGFVLAGLLLLTLKRLVPNEVLYRPVEGDKPPPWWIRSVLILTCTGVSFGHGSNDGQKGMGLIMLILIGMVPAHFALNTQQTPERVNEIINAATAIQSRLENEVAAKPETKTQLADVLRLLDGKAKYDHLSEAERLELRQNLFRLKDPLKALANSLTFPTPEVKQKFREQTELLRTPIEYVPLWVVIGVALALGVGTTVGWKRIVITVGEKIGKAHLSYAQGASAEVTAMATIAAADFGGLPVSTTQVLSSGVAGTMAANKSGVNFETIKKIALAWVLTLPVTMGLAALFYSIANMFLK